VLLGCGDFSLEDILQIYGKVMNSEKSDIALRIHHNVWMIALISEEQKDTSNSTRSTTIRELHKLRPVILLVVTIYMEVLLKSLVDILSLSVIFRMVL